MNVIHNATELRGNNRKVFLAIGFFDGVHLGHQQIIRQTIADAHQHNGLAMVITFDRHPNMVVAPDRVPPLIYSLPQKLRTIEALGTDTLLLIHFDQLFSEQPGEAFIRQLAVDLGQIKSICVGADFVFGHKRSGNVTLLKTLGRELGFSVHDVAAVSLDGHTVSSTRIRELIRAGDFDSASQMLGRPYSIAGRIVHGDRIGQKLGFPTANLETTDLLVPPTGVYIAHATVKGLTHRAVLNIGYRPTLNRSQPDLRVEVHLLDFNQELGDAEMEATFVEKLREEKRFPSVEDLKEQIARDIVEARQRF